MKKAMAILCLLTLLLSACDNNTNEASAESSMVSVTESSQITENEPQSRPQPESSVTEEEPDMLKIQITVGNKTFSATLFDNETSKALIDMLPLTLNMSELNGNEKFFYLDKSLPTNAHKPSGIKAGDIMLYGNNCLVLFYESFSTSYSYTPIGHIDDPADLAAALGNGDVQVNIIK